MNTTEINHPTQKDLIIEGNLMVNSHLKGTIYCDGTCIITEHGILEGELHTQRAHISGQFQGFLEVKEHVIFRDGSKFNGVLDASSMVCSLQTEIVGELRVRPNNP